MTEDNSREVKDSYLRLRSYINSDGKYIVWMNEDEDQMWADIGGESETLGLRPMELREQALSDLIQLVRRIRELEKLLGEKGDNNV
jgi:hypothetical protein